MLCYNALSAILFVICLKRVQEAPPGEQFLAGDAPEQRLPYMESDDDRSSSVTTASSSQTVPEPSSSSWDLLSESEAADADI